MPATRQQGLRVVTRKGTTILYLRGTVRGIRIFETAGTADPALAAEARSTREAELFRGALHGFAPVQVTWSEAALSYAEAEPRSPATLTFIKRLDRHLGTRSCRQIDQLAIDGACRALCRADVKPATKLRNVVAPARAVLMHAHRRGWCDVPKFESAKPGPPRTDWLRPFEAEAMIAAAGASKRQAHLKPLLVFLFCTGARLSEAIELDWGDVDLQHARAVLRDTKGGTDRQVDLMPRAVAEMANLAHRKGPVFRARGKAYRSTDQSRTVGYGGQIRKAWATCLAGAGITRHYTPHHARHSWASWHYAVHKDLMLLKQDGGWSDPSQAVRYTHLTPASIAPAVLAFWGGIGANSVQTPDAEHTKVA